MLALLLVISAGPPVGPLPPGCIARFGSTLLRHGSAIDFLAYSPDGAVLASGGGGALCLWDARTGQLRRRLDGPDLFEVAAAAFAPDGRRVAAAGRGITILDAASGRVALRAPLPAEACSVAWSPDGVWIAAGCVDEVIRVLAARTGRVSLEIKGLKRKAFSLSFRADGKRLASGGEDGVRVWDLGTGKPLWEAQAGPLGAFSVAFDPAGRRLATAGVLVPARLWDGEKGTYLGDITDRDADRVAYSRDGRLAVARHDGSVEVRSGAKLLRRWQASSGPLHALAFSPDGRWVAAAGHGQAGVGVWDAATGRPVLGDGHASPVVWWAVRPGGREVLALDFSGEMRRWGLADGTSAVVPGPAGGRWPTRTALSPDGALAAVPAADLGSITLFDLEAGRPVRRLAERGDSAADLAFSPDGRRLASHGPGEQARVWDVPTGRVTGRLLGAYRDHGHVPAWSPDGRRVLVAVERGLAYYDAGGRLLRTRAFHSLDSAAVAPDGRHAAVFTRYRSGRHLEMWDMGRDSITSLRHGTAMDWGGGPAFSPDGRLIALAVAGPVGRVSVREAATGQEVASLGRRDGGHVTVAWLDGRRLLSGGADASIWLWDAAGHRRPGALDAAGAASLWETLGEKSGVGAVWELAASPAGVACLAERLHPLKPADASALIAELGAEDPERWGRAVEGLRRMDTAAERALHEARYNRPARLRAGPAEAATRLLDEWAGSPERLRQRRAVWALELAATPEARAALKRVAGGAEGAWLTEVAKAALARMGR